MPGPGLGLGTLGQMPLGGASPDLQTLVERPVAFVYRAAQVQYRDAATGQYTGNWVDISAYVKQWGTIEIAVDDVRLNSFTDNGVTMVVNNDTGHFNHHSNPSSLWFGSLNRYRSLLRVQGAYYDTGSTAYTVPTDPTLGIFILDQEIGISSNNNDVTLRASSLKSVFDEVNAADIGGIFNTTLTADQIVAKIRDHTDGSGVFVFRQFITSTAWSITAYTNYYVLTTDAATNDNWTAWTLMDLLAEAEGGVVMVNRTGGLEFRPRGARQVTSQFSFSGQNFPRPNIIAINEYKEALDKFYNYFDLQYLSADTSTSHVHAGTATAVNITNQSWVNGARRYDFKNPMPSDTATAQRIVDNLFSATALQPPIEVTLEATFVPGLNVLDAVDVSYRSYDLANNALWDVFVWDQDVWGVDGANFDLNSAGAYLLAVRTDLDNLKTTFTARMT